MAGGVVELFRQTNLQKDRGSAVELRRLQDAVVEKISASKLQNTTTRRNRRKETKTHTRTTRSNQRKLGEEQARQGKGVSQRQRGKEIMGNQWAANFAHRADATKGRIPI